MRIDNLLIRVVAARLGQRRVRAVRGVRRSVRSKAGRWGRDEPETEPVGDGHVVQGWRGLGLVGMVRRPMSSGARLRRNCLLNLSNDGLCLGRWRRRRRLGLGY